MTPLLGSGPHVLTVEGLDLPTIEVRARRSLHIDGAEGECAQARGVVQRFERAWLAARVLPAPRGVVETSPLRRDRSGQLEHPSYLQGVASPALDARLECAVRVSAYVLTLGEAWDRALSSLCDDDEAADAWFLDHVANAWIDEAARTLERRLERDQARSGYLRAPRVRAGYRGHPGLGMQARLCDVTQAARIGVGVTDAGVLVPTKTVSGIVGWQPESR